MKQTNVRRGSGNEISRFCLHWGQIEFRWLESGSPRATCQWRICCLLLFVRCRSNWWTLSVLLWRMFALPPCCRGTGRWHVSYFKSEVWGRNEDWCRKTAAQHDAHLIHILSFAHMWHPCASLYVYSICWHLRCRAQECMCLCGFLCY